MRRLATVLALTATWAASPGSARAYEEAVTLGPAVGYAFVATDVDLPRHGPALGFQSSFGLNDVWSLRGTFLYALHPDAEAHLHVGVLAAEVLYLLDVVQLVAYGGLGLGGIGTILDGAFGVDPAIHAVIGLQYFVQRNLLVGFDVRPYVLPLSLNDRGVDPVYFTITAAIVWKLDRY